jgi:predicted MFS family arabinose efflux permease
MALNGIGVAVIEMFLIYYLKNKWTSFKWIGLGAILLIGSYLLLMLTHSIWILILNMILLTFSEMFAMPFMSTHSMKKSENKNAGDYMALYAMSWSTALILAPIIGSQIIEHWGYPVLWIVVSGFGLLSYFGFRYLEKIESAR